jgi:hypothetical protein
MIDGDVFYSPIQKALDHPKSLRLAVNAFCATCIGWPTPNWRNEIRECSSRVCPLLPHRPYQARGEGLVDHPEWAI